MNHKRSTSPSACQSEKLLLQLAGIPPFRSPSMATSAVEATTGLVADPNSASCCNCVLLGECPRAIIDSVGKLLFEKLVFTAAVGPVRLLLLNTHAALRARQWVVHTILRRPDYQVTMDLDTEAVRVKLP